MHGINPHILGKITSGGTSAQELKLSKPEALKEIWNIGSKKGRVV
jgi:hypothetical protein